jgi:hypothetical protein
VKKDKQDERAQLMAAYIRLASQNLRKDSKFFAEDMARIEVAAKRKTIAELRETLARMKATDTVSQAEMRTHSQFPKEWK